MQEYLQNLHTYSWRRVTGHKMDDAIAETQVGLYGAPFINLSFRPNSCHFSLIYKLAIVFTRADPACEDLFNTFIWF